MEGYSWTLPPAPSAPLAMGQVLRRKGKESAGGVHVGTEAGYVTVTRGLGSSLYSGRAGVQKSWWVIAIYSQPFRLAADVPRRAIFKQEYGLLGFLGGILSWCG